MKKNVVLALFGMLIIAGTGCKKCEEWYEKDGNDCVEIRTQYIGTYTGTATTGGQTANAQLTLTTNADGVNRLSFLFDGGASAYLELTSETAFSIPLQNVYQQGATSTVEGSGSFNSNQISVNYTATFQGQTAIVNFTGTK